MAGTAQWDDTFLKNRATDARDEALAQQCEGDWTRAAAQIKREVADVVRAFRRCPDTRCRRARRCLEQAHLACHHFGRVRASLPPDEEQELIQNVYAQMQEARRDAAEHHETEEDAEA